MPATRSKPLPLGGVDPLPKERLRSLLEEARTRTLELVEPLSEENLERVHSPLLSPLVWDLGHIAAFEDLWLCHHAGGLAPLRSDLLQVYDATETPRAERGDLPLLRHGEALDYMDAVRERSLEVLEAADVSPDGEGLHADGFVWEMVIAHEHQHNETMLQTLSIAEPGVYRPRRSPLPHPARGAPDGMVRLDGGRYEIGAPGAGFAYDNERGRHVVELQPFEIDRAPVTNGEYAEFVAARGYGRREWWSEDGWRWRIENAVERPLYWMSDGRMRSFERIEELDPLEPVMNVSWYEADAFARSRGKRLPTEFEWEAAATSDVDGHPRRYPWGDDGPTPERANLDQRRFGPAEVGAYPRGASAAGLQDLIGDAWEWTASDFDAYPGFSPYPYEQYSSIFFGGGYKVLRGGSWATRPFVARTTFRNWDYPVRRQIFTGFRCARDA